MRITGNIKNGIKKILFHFYNKYYKNENGFTLIEILIAATIGSFMMVILYQSYSSIIRYVSISTEEAEFYENVNLAIMKIDKDISNLYFKRENNNVVLVGEEESDTSSKINFVTVDHKEYNIVGSIFKNSPVSDIHEVGYYLAESKYPDEFNLIKREELHYDEEPEEGGVENIMLEGVTQFSVEYKEGNDWTGKWDSRQNRRVPEAIKITLKINHAETLRKRRKNQEYNERIEEFIIISRINMTR